MLGTADFTATTGTTVVLATGATTGDLIRTESFYVSSVLNAIPATAGSVSDSYIVSMAGSKLTGTQTIPKATLPTGCVLQVVQGSTSTSVSTSSSSFVTAGLAATITPSSSTSKVLAIVTLVACYTNAANREITATLYNGSTNLAPTGSGANKSLAWLYAASSAVGGNLNFEYLDSPATTSATTYTVYIAAPGASNVTTAVNGQTSYIQLMEIAA
jgi:hypothetical protein